MLNVLVNAISKNALKINSIDRNMKRMIFTTLLQTASICCIVKVVQDQEKRINSLEEEICELTSKGE